MYSVAQALLNPRLEHFGTQASCSCAGRGMVGFHRTRLGYPCFCCGSDPAHGVLEAGVCDRSAFHAKTCRRSVNRKAATAALWMAQCSRWTWTADSPEAYRIRPLNQRQTCGSFYSYHSWHDAEGVGDLPGSAKSVADFGALAKVRHCGGCCP